MLSLIVASYLLRTSMSDDQLTGSTSGADEKGASLKQRTIQSSVWTLVGYGFSQVLRLGSNLVLTRLLTPEAFGLMALVQTFLVGLQMFSDFGIFPNIVQSKRGEDPAFLNTAWTIQVIRGIGLWFVSCLIAIPIAQVYKEPSLVLLLPATGLSALIGGFSSTKLATANRRLALQRLTILDVSTYAISLVVMITAAWFYRSVWVLVIGGIVGSSLRVIASHVYLEGEKNSFYWDQEAVQEMRRFGRWIFLSTVFGFFAMQGDRLILGWLLDVRFLGIYTIALGLSSVVEQLVSHVNSKVLFPSYAELVRERPSSLYRVLRKARLVLILLSASSVVFLVFFGKWLIDVLYDDRYLEAGWMLRILAIGFLGRVLSSTYEDVLMARGQTFVTMSFTIAHTCVQLALMVLGSFWFGAHGVVFGIAAGDWITYVSYAVYFTRLSLWQPELDLPAAFLAGAMLIVVYYT